MEGSRIRGAGDADVSTAGLDVRGARAVVRAEIRAIETELETIRPPSRTEVAHASMRPSMDMLRDEADIRLSELRQPAVDAHLDLLKSSPVFGASDLISLGVLYLARLSRHRRAVMNSQHEVDTISDRFSLESEAASEIYAELTEQAADRRRKVERHISLSARARGLMSAIETVREAHASDRIRARGLSVDDVASDLVEQAPDLVARARARMWLEALQRAGVSPRLNVGGISPLVGLLRREIHSLTGADAGAVEFLDNPPSLITVHSVPGDRVRRAMDAIACLRRNQLTSEEIVAAAARSVVNDIDPEDLPAACLQTRQGPVYAP